MRVDRSGHSSLFFQGMHTISELRAALGIVNRGYVFGPLVGQYANSSYAGPWGMAILDGGNVAHVFVSNVLNGTITRLDVAFPSGALPVVHKATPIGTGFSHRADPAALELGPSGLAYDAKHDVLYVASTADDAVYELSAALTAKAGLGSGEGWNPGSAHYYSRR